MALNNEKDYNLILNFITSDIVEKIKNAESVETEIMFTTSQKSNELYFDSNDDQDIMLQGVVDLLIKLDSDNYIIVDYKTDYVTKKDGEKILKERHREQLNIYTNALKKYYNNKITVKKYIYSYVLCKFIEIE